MRKNWSRLFVLALFVLICGGVAWNLAACTAGQVGVTQAMLDQTRDELAFEIDRAKADGVSTAELEKYAQRLEEFQAALDAAKKEDGSIDPQSLGTGAVPVALLWGVRELLNRRKAKAA